MRCGQYIIIIIKQRFTPEARIYARRVVFCFVYIIIRVILLFCRYSSERYIGFRTPSLPLTVPHTPNSCNSFYVLCALAYYIYIHIKYEYEFVCVYKNRILFKSTNIQFSFPYHLIMCSYTHVLIPLPDGHIITRGTMIFQFKIKKKQHRES